MDEWMGAWTADLTRTALAAAAGVAIEVPALYSRLHDSCCASSERADTEKTEYPGATSSGFSRPSAAGPCALNVAMVPIFVPAKLLFDCDGI
jgi:hypothetical protein